MGADLVSFPWLNLVLLDTRLLLETKYRRLPVVDGAGKLVRTDSSVLPRHASGVDANQFFLALLATSQVGIITRGNVVRAALQIKRANHENNN